MIISGHGKDAHDIKTNVSNDIGHADNHIDDILSHDINHKYDNHGSSNNNYEVLKLA